VPQRGDEAEEQGGGEEDDSAGGHDDAVAVVAGAAVEEEHARVVRLQVEEASARRHGFEEGRRPARGRKEG
jgi:hypothetical protein